MDDCGNYQFSFPLAVWTMIWIFFLEPDEPETFGIDVSINGPKFPCKNCYVNREDHS